MWNMQNTSSDSFANAFTNFYELPNNVTNRPTD
jgi:hypothetical protein